MRESLVEEAIAAAYEKSELAVRRANMLLGGATRMGIAAVYAPNSKYKVFWALILAVPAEGRG